MRSRGPMSAPVQANEDVAVACPGQPSQDVAREHVSSGSPIGYLRQAAWYAEAAPTLIDALALVRHHVWSQMLLPTSLCATDLVKVPQASLDHLTDILCYAA